jgi:predicted MFS family arabinose efflux permease
MYTTNASAMAGSLARPEERGRALAMVYVGLSLATVFGVPIGTVVANIGTWRGTFVFVAFIGFIATVGVAKFLPEAPRRPPLTFSQWAGVFTDRNVLAVLSVTTIFFTAHFAAFTYIAKTVTAIAGENDLAIPAALFLFGAAGFTGNSLAGRFTDTWGAARTIRLATALMAAGLAATTPLLHFELGSIGTVGGGIALIIWGLGGWAINPAQQVRLLATASTNGPTVLAANSSALYLGTALGGLLGSTILRTVGVTWIGIVSALLALTVFALVRSTHSLSNK